MKAVSSARLAMEEGEGRSELPELRNLPDIFTTRFSPKDETLRFRDSRPKQYLKLKIKSRFRDSKKRDTKTSNHVI